MLWNVAMRKMVVTQTLLRFSKSYTGSCREFSQTAEDEDERNGNFSLRGKS